MFTRYLLPLIAVAGLSFAVFTVVQGSKTAPPSQPLVPPPMRPKEFRSIAGAGLIEARMENIPVGTPTAGLVWEVYVKIDQRVQKGDPLFRLDDRNLQAERKVRESNLASARAQLVRIQAAPTLMDVPTAEAAVEEAEARMNDSEVMMGRSGRLVKTHAGSQSDFDRDRFAYSATKAALAKAKADLNRIKVTWAQDQRVSEAAVEQAQAMLESTKIEIDRLTVRAQADGKVLQVNVRPGQFAAVVWKEPLVVLGDVDRLHVRVDIDEQDLPLFQPGAPAIATLKGMPQVEFALEFVKVEPFVIPKKSLTGDNSERVDTRVLQVVYSLPDEREVPVYVGQQMDVYLKAAQLPKGRTMGGEVKKPFEDEPTPPPTPSKTK